MNELALALDVGNSGIKVGLFSGERLLRTATLSRERALTAEVGAFLGEERPALAAFASVVPHLSVVVGAVAGAFAERVVEVGVGLPLPFQLDYETPKTLGTDRLAAAAGALLRHNQTGARAIVVIDAGTAVTCEVITYEGAAGAEPEAVYRGGIIAPGLALLASSLHAGTAQLPAVAPPTSPAVIGTSTHGAIESGVAWGFVGMVRGFVESISAEIAETGTGAPLLVLTGGDAARLLLHLDAYAPIHAPHLVLEGALALARYARSTKRD